MAKDYAAAARKAEKFGTQADESPLKHSGELENSQRNSTEAARTQERQGKPEGKKK
jgi:hypothetical protein